MTSWRSQARCWASPSEVVKSRTSALAVAGVVPEILLEGTLDAGQLIEEEPSSQIHRLSEPMARVRWSLPANSPAPAIRCLGDPAGLPSRALLISEHRDCHQPRPPSPAQYGSLIASSWGLGGAGRLAAVASLREPRPGDAPSRRCSPLGGGQMLLDQVTVVDQDIDIADPLQVDRAVANRMKADRGCSSWSPACGPIDQNRWSGRA